MNSEEEELLSIFEAGSLISNSEKNLRSKISSINRSLENLMAKRNRIDYEIRKQKKSLTRKREELKRATTGSPAKMKSLIQESGDDRSQKVLDFLELRKYDSKLLSESDRLLDL